MIEIGVGPLQPEKHTLPKWAYRKYKIWNTNMEEPKPNSLRKVDGA
jgi:hypothetical protein